MELIFLVGIGIVIGIPAVAILALVRSRAAERRIEAGWLKISGLQSEIASLKNEVARLSYRVNELQASEVATTAEDRQVSARPAPVKAAIEPAFAKEENAAPVRSPQTSTASSSLDRTTVAAYRPEPLPAPEVSFKADEQPVSAGTAAFEAHVQPEVVTERVTAAGQPAHASEGGAIPPTPVIPVPFPPTPAIPVPFSTPSIAAKEPAAPRESLFQRLKTNLPLEQFLGMNLFAKVGIVLLVLGLALLGRIALIAMGPGLRVALIYVTAAAMLGGGTWLERRERYRLLGRTSAATV
jgi:hypothetical protein